VEAALGEHLTSDVEELAPPLLRWEPSCHQRGTQALDFSGIT